MAYFLNLDGSFLGWGPEMDENTVKGVVFEVEKAFFARFQLSDHPYAQIDRQPDHEQSPNRIAQSSDRELCLRHVDLIGRPVLVANQPMRLVD